MIVDATDFMLLLSRFGRRKGRRPPAPPSAAVVVGQTEKGEPVLWPAASRDAAAHVAVLAASGAGKTVLVAAALVRELVAEQARAPEERTAHLVVDPKGDTVVHVLQGLVAEAPELLSEVVYLNPFSSAGFPFNVNLLAQGETPVEIRAMQLASLVADVSTATGAQRHLGVGARQVDALYHVILGALEADLPGAHVLLALEALTMPQGMQRLAAVTRSTRARDFLSNANLSAELLASTSSRLRTAFAATSQLERLVTANACLQWGDVLGPGRVVLVDLGAPPGGVIGLTTFWANLLVRLAIEHLMDRPSPWPGWHVRVIADEAQIIAPVLDDAAERVLTTGRSRGVSLVTLSQGTTLLADASLSLLRVILTNTPTKFVGRLNAPDAELLAREQSPGAGIDETVGEVRSRFSAAVTNLADRSFFALTPGKRLRFRSAAVDLAAWREAAEREALSITAAKERLALPPGPVPRVTLPELRRERRRAPAPRGERGPGRGPNPPAERPRQPGAPAPAGDQPPRRPPRPRSPWG